MRTNKSTLTWRNCVCVIALSLAFSSLAHANSKPLADPISPKISAAAKGRIQATFLSAPLHFEPNQGQANEPVKFLARGGGYSLFLTSTEAVMVLQQSQQQTVPVGVKTSRSFSLTPKSKSGPVDENPKSSMVRMKLVGANPDATVEGLEQLPGKVNYFIGNDSKKWRTNIPTYERLKYKEVYPGINLVFYGNQRQLEYDFVVAPGVDAEVIKITFEGADKVEMEDGEIVVKTASGFLRMHKPFVYQDVAGVRKPVRSNYVWDAKLATLSFKVAAHDSTKPLIIDPVLSYSTYVNTDRSFELMGVAVDSLGNAYVAGVGYVAKYNPVGSLVYRRAFSGSWVQAIALDSSGNAYVTGSDSSSQLFVAKLDTTGAFVYFTYLGGRGHGYGIAVDSFGDAYATGFTESSTFPTVNAFQPAFGGGIFEPTLGGSPRDAFMPS